MSLLALPEPYLDTDQAAPARAILDRCVRDALADLEEWHGLDDPEEIAQAIQSLADNGDLRLAKARASLAFGLPDQAATRIAQLETHLTTIRFAWIQLARIESELAHR